MDEKIVKLQELIDQHDNIVFHIYKIERFSTAHAVIAVNTSVKLQYLPTACHLMKVIDILCDHCFEFACLFQFCKLQVSRIWFCGIAEHLIPVKFVKFLRIIHKKRMT